MPNIDDVLSTGSHILVPAAIIVEVNESLERSKQNESLDRSKQDQSIEESKAQINEDLKEEVKIAKK